MAFSGRRVPRVPRTVSWILTLECDHRCKHCYVEAGTRTPGELSPAARRSVLLELVRAGVRFVIFSGGDPLRCSDLPDLLELARGFGLHTAVCTTAGSLDEAMARRLRDLGVSLVSLSLDAPLAEDHDRLRGLPGSFQRTIEALRRCRRVGLAVELDTTLTRPTGSDVLALLTLAEENGATSVDLRRFAPGSHPGLLLVRLHHPSRRRLLGYLNALFVSEDVSAWSGCFVVATDHKLRIRRPPR